MLDVTTSSMSAFADSWRSSPRHGGIDQAGSIPSAPKALNSMQKSCADCHEAYR
jgi:hypothetical protein